MKLIAQTAKMNKTARLIIAVKTSFPAPMIHASDSVVFVMANVTALVVKTSSIARSRKSAMPEVDANTLVSSYPTVIALFLPR